MATSRSLENNEDEITFSSELPEEVNSWNKDHVRKWLLTIKVDKEDAEILYKEKICGNSLFLLEKSELTELGLSMNAKKLIIHNRDLLKQKTPQPNNLVTQSCSLKPYPFKRFNVVHRYQENIIFDATESGTLDYIQPCHEFKACNNFESISDMMKKYTYEVIRFAAACMNSRTNGTIHFGVGDAPNFAHGQILGISVPNTDIFDRNQSNAIVKHFKQERYVIIAKRCIMPPRIVEVLKADMTSTGKRVIEVDIEPSFIVCEEYYFNTYEVDKNEEKKQTTKGAEWNDGKSFFIREGSSSKNLLASNSSKEYDKYIAAMPQLSQLRKDAEEKHLSDVKDSVQGSKLCEMITGGSQSLDRSHFERYLVVANKSHPVQLENLNFLLYMNLMAVLDFDPESAENGLNKLFEDRITNVHLPAQYKITGAVEDIADKLKLTKNTSWVFCNGGIKEDQPADVDNWLTEKGSCVRDVVSFLCRKDVLPHKKFLVIFLLLNHVIDGKDPLLETFSMFLQELNGTHQILCICDNEMSYTYWKDLIKGRYGVDISKRCIYELNFAEINGSVLSLWSENRKSSRFLPCGGGSKVVLSKKAEDTLETLRVLCVNQCDGGDEDKQQHEERFYKGGKVSWWNFYFSEQPGSVPFIKRDKFNYIINTIIPDMRNLKSACVCLNIFHLPGCGGTTLAMHVLWTLKDKFRCAELKDKSDNFTDVAQQVVQLLTYETNEQPKLPVLLMIDDFEDLCDVKKLQLQIEEECQKQNIFSKSPQVILVNCMRVESREQMEGTDDVVFIGNNLSEEEQKLFREKLKELKKTNTNTKTFYGFMILKTNFSSEYIQRVVENTLKGFNFQHKNAQLFSILVLLHVYCRNALLSVSTCEEFLDLPTKANTESCKIEDGFEKFSTLLTRCPARSNVDFEGMTVIHAKIAECSMAKLATTHKVTKAEITNLLLTTDLFYAYTLGKQKLMQDVHSMLMKRYLKDQFSPLIQDIMKETPGMEETVLNNAAKCYRKDAVIFQLLARYHYIKKQDFTMAITYAKKAKALSENNSYICDTVAQIQMRELECAFRRDKDDPIKPDSLRMYLELVKSATKACKETQQTADKEVLARLKRRNDYKTYNTAGFLSELQVAVKVIKILKKTPLFHADESNRLGQVLSGQINVQTLAQKEPALKPYYDVLQENMSYLLTLKHTMRQHFDVLGNYFVHLDPFFASKDKPKELIQPKVQQCFLQYTELFCNINWSGDMVRNQHLNTVLKVELTRQCLERNKGESYTGILGYLYEKDCPSTLEEIIQQYLFLSHSNEDGRCDRDAVNFIYANVILANINPASRYIMPYKNLCAVLHQIIQRTTSFSDILPLHYIAVSLLWQEAYPELPSFVSQMRASYSQKLKHVSSGKRAAVHFYLGNGTEYRGLISQRGINSCLKPKQMISTQWDDEKTWEQVKGTGILYRASGEIRNNFILADTLVTNVKVNVYPMFKSLLHNEQGTRVTFFIGFSMNGPVALDIDYES
ncbi:sterile alpha motif domain-containing protein 9-like [Xyrauchen texanus]|uniref:sterile alpha motif domain-containing protein 9-like n=1 Tax=Xyrauchen texanus TaxID=154827 RepID=UPI002241A836|nr:sterile alpha motif domain-containing protein 9-like [Xyrauchen texanus]